MSFGYTVLGFGSESVEKYNVDFLSVAGGGGGGSRLGGGGGGGGFRNSFSSEASGGGGSSEAVVQLHVGYTYTITIGAGGADDVSGSNTSISG